MMLTYVELRSWIDDYLSRQDVILSAPIDPNIEELRQAIEYNGTNFYADINGILKKLAPSFAKLRTLEHIFKESCDEISLKEEKYSEHTAEFNSVIMRFNSINLFSASSESSLLLHELSFDEVEAIKDINKRYIEDVFSNKFPDGRARRFTVIHEYIEYIKVFKAIKDARIINEIIDAGFPKEVKNEIMHMYSLKIPKVLPRINKANTDIHQPEIKANIIKVLIKKAEFVQTVAPHSEELDLCVLLEDALRSKNVTQVANIVKKIPFTEIKCKNDLREIKDVVEYNSYVNALKYADNLSLIVTLIKSGFPLPLLAEMLNKHPDTGGKIFLNILCPPDGIISSAYKFKTEVAKLNTLQLVQDNYKIMSLLCVFIMSISIYNRAKLKRGNFGLTIFCNFNALLSGRELENFVKSVNAVLKLHDASNEERMNMPSRFNHSIILGLQILRIFLSYKLQEKMFEYNTFAICALLLSFSWVYSVFILPIAEAFLINDLLDSQPLAYAQARKELEPILNDQKNSLPPPPILFRNLSLQSQYEEDKAAASTTVSDSPTPSPANTPCNTPLVTYYGAGLNR